MLSLLLLSAVATDCAKEPSFRVDCGHLGTDQPSCEAQGCCWRPVDPNPGNEPWCYKPTADVKTCSLAATPQEPFSSQELDEVKQLLLANVNWKGSGMVVAAPDPDTGPGGNYEYAWMRDEALTMRALEELSLLTPDLAEAWRAWIARSVNEQDPNTGQGLPDVLSEPKFEIPSGTPYTGGWCRPQNDGPGLRAIALMGLPSPQLDASTGLVYRHLDWVAQNWTLQGCDLWEEVRSDDFFWNRYTMRAALLQGADFAQQHGDAPRAQQYGAAAAALNKTLAGHIASGWVFESQGRQLDTAVLEAFNVGDRKDGVFAPLSAEVVQTLVQLTRYFCSAFEVNQEQAKKGAGVLYGRYSGDTYDGGNPWPLLSATAATVLYRMAAEAQGGAAAPAALEELLGPIHDLPTQLLGAGDSILLFMKTFLQPGLHINEQIDRSTGELKSAKDLTWGYVNVLKAMKARAQVRPAAVVV